MSIRTLLRLLAVTVICFLAMLSHALTIDDYSPELLKKAQTTNQSHAIVFHADWCPACKAQMKSFEQLKSDASLKNMTIYVADHDGENELKKALKVRGQSTVIVYKGAKEVARSVSDTTAVGLQKLLKQAL